MDVSKSEHPKLSTIKDYSLRAEYEVRLRNFYSLLSCNAWNGPHLSYYIFPHRIFNKSSVFVCFFLLLNVSTRLQMSNSILYNLFNFVKQKPQM